MMLSPIARRRPLLFGAMLLVMALGTACEDDPVEMEPEVETLLILFPGPDTVAVDVATGDVTGGPITISATTPFTAEFLRSDGSPDPLVTGTDFRLDVTSGDAGIVTFTRSSAFAGTLNKVTTGSTNITFALFHLGEQHNEFSRPVPITVN